MAKQLMDDEVSLKRRARRRLIGAVALVIVIVVLLPMVLDSEPKLGGQDIELRIPDKDKVGEFMPKMGMPSAPVSVLAVSSPVAVPVSAVPSLPVIKEQVVAASQTIESKLAPVKSEVKSVGEIHIENRKITPHSGFVVQVGAFANADTAHQWQKKLNEQNIKVYTEKVGNKIRVRAGPYATREAADNIYKKLEAQGLKPTVSPAY
ncbi:SPOR domain-containing protein [Candidatus Nitrotoga arctica]|uniref:DedD protein n=1 Tax=Candidatus Nitrotoga arctica TaxID=453162 RepID=A0ABM8YXD2_9PROT|nr:SPOR domain-containing protein [Candidatus Nitrotoga arctica]CAG9932185.1 DedD protein [Candidatus Nitrotoga arctica]